VLGNVRKPWMLLKTLLTEMCATLRENDAIRRAINDRVEGSGHLSFPAERV
jgi:hypothetical protein